MHTVSYPVKRDQQILRSQTSSSSILLSPVGKQTKNAAGKHPDT